MNVDSGSKFAPCELLALIHGVDTSKNTWGIRSGARVLCKRPTECWSCPLFQELGTALTEKGGQVKWACFRCLGPGRERGVARGTLLGYYSSGQCSWCGEEGIVLNAVHTDS